MKNNNPVSISEFYNVLNVISDANMNDAKLSVCLWGVHGYGKTQNIKQYAKDYMNGNFVDVPIAQFEEMGDFLGMPRIENGQTVYTPPSWVPTAEGPGILLIDDFTRTNTRILNGIMQLIQDYETKAWKLPKGWTIVCTANPEQQGNYSYSTNELDFAQLTRMSHFDIKYDHDALMEYFYDKGYNAQLLYFFDNQTGGEVLKSQDNPKVVPRTVEYFLKAVDSFKELPKSGAKLDTLITIARGYFDNNVAHSLASYLIKGVVEIPVLSDLITRTPTDAWNRINALILTKDGINLEIAKITYMKAIADMRRAHRDTKLVNEKLMSKEEYKKIHKLPLVDKKLYEAFADIFFPLDRTVQNEIKIHSIVATFASKLRKQLDEADAFAHGLNLNVRNMQIRLASLLTDKKL